MEYRIIFTGQLDTSLSVDIQSQVVTKLSGIAADKAKDILLAGKPGVIRNVKSKADADKVLSILNGKGIKSIAKPISGAPNQSNETQVLKQQVKSLQIEVAELRAQMNSLSEFVDEYVHKKDFDTEELSNDIDDLLGLGNDDFEASQLPKETSQDDVDELSIDTEPTFLSKALPFIISGGVVAVIGLLAWQYLLS